MRVKHMALVAGKLSQALIQREVLPQQLKCRQRHMVINWVHKGAGGRQLQQGRGQTWRHKWH